MAGKQHVEPRLAYSRARRARTADPGDRAAAAAEAVLKPLLDGYRGPVAIRLWNGERIAGPPGAPCTVVVRHPGPLKDLVLRGDLVRMAEAHLAGLIDLEGDPEALFDLVEYLDATPPARGARLKALWRALRLPGGRADHGARQATGWAGRHNSEASIAHHYDVGNDFYRLWLDPEMVYSCAYFQAPDQPLAEAQADKLDYICRKLRLRAGQTLLDVGCGWGALLRWAARHYGVRAHGITLSRRQAAVASARARQEGLADRVSIELRDYRDLPAEPRYDAVVSVGMFEHVGLKNLPGYFAALRRALRPGGLFLNHGITNDTGWRRTACTRFMNRYVFPDGELTSIGDVVRQMERAGFEILDLEALRRHYALTLRAWLKALESRKVEAVRRVGDATYRVWRLYMAGAAYYFDEGSTNVYQVLAGPAHGPLAVPLRRDDLYRDPLPAP